MTPRLVWDWNKYHFRKTLFVSTIPKVRHPYHLQEGGSRLTALKCLTQSCKGSMFPENPLEMDTKWQCEVCGCQVTGRQAYITQATLGRLLSIVDNRNIPQMERFLSQHQHVMPSSNQILIEVKCNLIRSYGHAKGYSWTGGYTAQLTFSGVYMTFLCSLFCWNKGASNSLACVVK